MGYSRRRNKKKAIFSLIRIIFSILLIILAIFLIKNIFVKVSNIEIAKEIEVVETTESMRNVENKTVKEMFVNDETGMRYKKIDNTFAKAEWIEKNGEVFYFGDDTYAYDGVVRFEGQKYTCVKGRVTKMEVDTTYSINVNNDYFSSVESTQYLVYLEKNANQSGYYPIKYKRYSDNFEDYLGTKFDIQYSTPYLIKTNQNNIYYLAKGKKEKYSGMLCRMKPNASFKETIGKDVEGYIILSNDSIYYYDGEYVKKANYWKSVTLKKTEEEQLEEAMHSTPVETKEGESKTNLPGEEKNKDKNTLNPLNDVANQNNDTSVSHVIKEGPMSSGDNNVVDTNNNTPMQNAPIVNPSVNSPFGVSEVETNNSAVIGIAPNANAITNSRTSPIPYENIENNINNNTNNNINNLSPNYDDVVIGQAPG